MSLPLRHPLESVTSLDRVLEDLIVRFIINCPPEDFSSVERELFHIEEATWFYTDFVKIMNPKMPNLKIKSFAQHVIKLCPMVWKWDVRAEQALQKFSQYKRSIPVRGAAIFNKTLTKLLLVKGIESESWSFPRGKISKDENDVDCCIREVMEEIGFDISEYIDEDQFIERNIGGKNYKIFLVSGVPEDFDFQPQVRNEIEKIQWHDFKKLSRNTGNKHLKIYLVNTLMRPLTMWAKSHRQIDNDEKLKSHVEAQLKLLLGIRKEETPDPGRELLNMLQNSVTAPPATSTTTEPRSPTNVNPSADASSKETSPPRTLPPISVVPPTQFQQNFPFMAFQPFAPFPFMNGSGMQPGATGHVPGHSIPNAAQTQPPPTPSMNDLAKPTVVEEEQKEITSFQDSAPEHPRSTTSKQLLDLLNRKSADTIETPRTPQESTKPKFTILKRGQNLENTTKETPPQSSSDSDSKVLLGLLKKPHAATATTDKVVPEVTSNPTPAFETLPVDSKIEPEIMPKAESEYEDFESSSEGDDYEDGEEEQKDEYEGFKQEPTITVPTRVSNDGGLANGHAPVPESTPKNINGSFEVLNKKPLNISEQSTGGTFVSKSSNVKQKPKFKLLKRGESLRDVGLDNQDKLEGSLESSAEPLKIPQSEKDGKALLNLLQKTNISAPIAHLPHHHGPATSENGFTKPSSMRTESLSPGSVASDRSCVKPDSYATNASDSQNLLSLLKKEASGPLEPLPESTPELQRALCRVEASRGNSSLAAGDFLNMLQNQVYSPATEEVTGHFQSPFYPHSTASSGMQVQPPFSPHSNSSLPATQNQVASQQLLGMLKKPEANGPASPGIQYMGTNNMPYGIEKNAPHELLSLLQKK